MKGTVAAAAALLSAALGALYALGAACRGRGEARENALYMLARSAALTLLAGLSFPFPGLAAPVNGALLILQLGDAAVGLRSRSLPRTAGPLLMALAHGACLLWLLL